MPAATPDVQALDRRAQGDGDPLVRAPQQRPRAGPAPSLPRRRATGPRAGPRVVGRAAVRDRGHDRFRPRALEPLQKRRSAHPTADVRQAEGAPHRPAEGLPRQRVGGPGGEVGAGGARGFGRAQQAAQRCRGSGSPRPPARAAAGPSTIALLVEDRPPRQGQRRPGLVSVSESEVQDGRPSSQRTGGRAPPRARHERRAVRAAPLEAGCDRDLDDLEPRAPGPHRRSFGAFEEAQPVARSFPRGPAGGARSGLLRLLMISADRACAGAGVIVSRGPARLSDHP